MQKYELLIQLADACNDGACNTYSLIRSLARAVEPIPGSDLRENPAVKCILGHLSYLCNESIGPTAEAAEAYDQWKAKLQQQEDLKLLAELGVPV